MMEDKPMTDLERVALALHEVLNRQVAAWIGWNRIGADVPLELARVAIQAIREPSEEMMAAVDCAGEKREWLRPSATELARSKPSR